MNTATALNQQSQANLSGVTNASNNAAGAIANTANQNLQQYGSVFNPLQSTEAQAAQQYGSSQNVALLQGQAVGNANAADQAALANSRAALASEGVDPASLGGAAMQQQAAVSGAANAANAGTQSAIQTQQTAFGMENQANQLGVQVGQMGTAGEAAGAQTAQAGQNTVNSTNASNVNNLTAANSYLNTDVNANNSAVQAANTQFGEQQQVYTDQQQQQAGVGQIIGQVAGIAGMAMMESGGPVPGGAGVPGPLPGIPMMGKRMRATHQRAGIPAPSGNGPPISSAYCAGGEVMSQGGNVTARGALPSSPIPGSTDTKPALLTPGEWVMPKDVVDFKGQEFFHKQVDSIRNQMNKRRAIPVFHPPHVSAHP
jgi:hypothetical protein